MFNSSRIDSLQAFYAGVQLMNGDLDEAICFHALYFAIWRKFDVLPERFNWRLKGSYIFLFIYIGIFFLFSV